MRRHRCHGGVHIPFRDDDSQYWTFSTGLGPDPTHQTFLPDDTVRIVMGCPHENGVMNGQRVIICNSHPRAASLFQRCQLQLIGLAESVDDINATRHGFHLCAVIPHGKLIFMALKYLRPTPSMPFDWRFHTFPNGAALHCGFFGDQLPLRVLP